MAKITSVICVLSILFSSTVFGQQQKAGEVPVWGEIVNPKKDCKFLPLDETLKVTLPATAHDLSIEINRMNAPRLVRPVTGDFTIQVKVAGVSHPQSPSTIPNRRPFCSAGLLIWSNERNYIRLERASLLAGNVISTYASWELRQDGKFVRAGRNDDLPLKGAVSWLRITRTGDSFVGAASHDGQDWMPLPSITLAGNNLRAGILAVNDTPTPFSPVFSDFSLRQTAEK